MPTIYDAFILQALELPQGNQFYIPCEDKQEQKKIEKILKEAISRLPIQHQMALRVARTFKDKRLWVVIAKKKPSHEEFFVKHQDRKGGWTVSRLSLDTSAERLRVIEAMVEDGLTEEEIVEILGPISSVEQKLFFPEEEMENGN
jgi:hypothetical protein